MQHVTLEHRIGELTEASRELTTLMQAVLDVCLLPDHVDAATDYAIEEGIRRGTLSTLTEPRANAYLDRVLQGRCLCEGTSPSTTPP